MSHRKGSKFHTNPHNNDFIALGAKSQQSSVNSGPVISSVSGSSSSVRSNSPSIVSTSAQSVRKALSCKSQSSKPSTIPPFGIGVNSTAWESSASDISNIIESLGSEIRRTHDSGNEGRSTSLILGLIRALKSQRAKPDVTLLLVMLYVAKSRPNAIYSSSASTDMVIVNAMASILRRDVKESYKAKGNATLSVAIANTLQCVFDSFRTWPCVFIRVYSEDALGERVWVDCVECSNFVDNICSAFSTRKIRDSEDSTSSDDVQVILPQVQQRFEPHLSSIEDFVMDSIREQFNHRSSSLSRTVAGASAASVSSNSSTSGSNSSEVVNVTRPLLKFLIATSGLVKVRHAVISRIESWLMNPKFSRLAHDLLLSISINCHTFKPLDVEVIAAFAKIRVKTKLNLHQYLQCVKEICKANCNNLPLLLQTIIYNELSVNNRNPNNMAILSLLFHTSNTSSTPDTNHLATASLAAIYKELLMQRDCYLKALRGLLREIVRNFRQSYGGQQAYTPVLDLQLFVSHLLFTPDTVRLEQPSMRTLSIPPKSFEFRDRYMNSIVDLSTLAIFLCVTQHVRSEFAILERAATQGSGGGNRTPTTSASSSEHLRISELSSLQSFYQMVTTIQLNCISWISMVPTSSDTAPSSVSTQLVCKTFIMSKIEEYVSLDNWPSEGERPTYVKLCSEVPFTYALLTSVINLTKTIGMPGAEVINLVEFLVTRAASLQRSWRQVETSLGNHSSSSRTPSMSSIDVVMCDESMDDMDIPHCLAFGDGNGLSACLSTMKSLFDLALYTYPSSITLPSDYSPPRMAISVAYWKVWTILLFYVAHNPLDMSYIWRESSSTDTEGGEDGCTSDPLMDYDIGLSPSLPKFGMPMLATLVEMCITGVHHISDSSIVIKAHFGGVDESKSNPSPANLIKLHEQQISRLEKDVILTFEQHLSNASMTEKVNSQKVINESNSLLLSSLIGMSDEDLLCQTFRQIPKSVLDQIAQYDAHFQIGQLLAKSRRPDFLLDILRVRRRSYGSSPSPSSSTTPCEEQSDWLKTLIDSNKSSLHSLPVECLAEFILHQFTFHGPAAPAITSSPIFTLVRNHLSTLIRSSDSRGHVVSSCKILKHFGEHLSSKVSVHRVAATHSFSSILSQDHSQVGGTKITENVEGFEVAGTNSWLVDEYPTIPAFSPSFPAVSNSIRRALAVECDPELLATYIRFLCHYAATSSVAYDVSEQNPSGLLDLCFDISSLIVERTSIVQKLFSVLNMSSLLPSTSKSLHQHYHISLITYLSVIKMFVSATKLILDEGSDSPLLRSVMLSRCASPSTPDELITVVWEQHQTGDLRRETPSSTVIHFLLVHAQLILLTYKPSISSPHIQSSSNNNPLHLAYQDSLSAYSAMLHLWFPYSPQSASLILPRAFLSPSSLSSGSGQPTTLGEEAQLIPDWLKLKMIRCANEPVLVDVALSDLEPSQLVLFIQSFGIPVVSMSRLLSSLDVLCHTDSNRRDSVILRSQVVNAVVDKVYMTQLLKVQMRRGAKGGLHFARALGIDDDLDVMERAASSSGNRRDHVVAMDCSSGGSREPMIPPRSTAMIPPGQVRGTLMYLFDVGSPTRACLNSVEKQNMFRTLQKSMVTEVSEIPRMTKPGQNISLPAMCEQVFLVLYSFVVEEENLAMIDSIILRHVAYATSLLRLIVSLVEKSFTKLYKEKLTRISHVLYQHVTDKRKSLKNTNLASPLLIVLSKYCDVKTAAHVVKSTTDNLNSRITDNLVDDGVTVKLESMSTSSKIHVLFGKGNGIGSNNTMQKSVMITKLLHESNWHTLNSVIHDLLTMHDDFTKTVKLTSESPSPLNITSILDFFEACAAIPRLWRGRDKFQPESRPTSKDVDLLFDSGSLKANDEGQKVLALVNFIVKEYFDGLHGDGVKEEEKGDEILVRRLQFLLQCLNRRKRRVQRVASYLFDQSKVYPYGSDARWAFRLVGRCLYSRFPSAFLHIPKLSYCSFLDVETSSTGGSTSLLASSSVLFTSPPTDRIVHEMFSSLSATKSGGNWAIQMQDFETALVKLCNSHPFLVLSHLSLMSTVLAGRLPQSDTVVSGADFASFRFNNHMTLFAVVIRLLNYLRPYVFHKQYNRDLCVVLRVYDKMILSFNQRIDSMLGLINKYCLFVTEYAVHDSRSAGLYVASCADTFRMVCNSTSSSKIDCMPDLIRFVDYCHRRRSISSNPSFTNMYLREYFEKYTSNRMNSVLKRVELNLDNPISIISNLTDLNTESSSDASLLMPYVSKLAYLIYDHECNKSVRNLCYKLLVRVLRHDYASSVSPVFNYYMKTLSDGVEDDVRVESVDSAHEKLAIMVPLMRERGGEILSTVFKTGVLRQLNVSGVLVDTLQTLNLHSGY